MEHIVRHAAGDLFLDTLIYGAHSTATDSMRGVRQIEYHSTNIIIMISSCSCSSSSTINSTTDTLGWLGLGYISTLLPLLLKIYCYYLKFTANNYNNNHYY